MSYYHKHVFVCTNQKAAGKQCCANAGGEKFVDYLKAELKALDLHGTGKIRVSKTGCLGRCSSGPCLVIYPEGQWYQYNSKQDINLIITNHLLNNQIVEPLSIDN